MSFTPSVARTIALTQVEATTTEVLRFPQKTPGEVVDYSFDITVWTADAHDTVATFTTTVNGSVQDVTVAQQPVNGNVLTILVSGGTSGNDYSITFTATTVTPPQRTFSRTVWMLCESSAPDQATTPPVTVGAQGPPGPNVPATATQLGSLIIPPNSGFTVDGTGRLMPQVALLTNLFGAWMQSLPTVHPGTAGQPWNNGGVPCIS